jgi:hypothetical protein
MRHFFLLITVFFFVSKSKAQNIENVSFEILDSVISIKFDLVNSPSNAVYNLNVFFTKNDGSNVFPKNITPTTGIQPKKNIVLIWDYKLDNFIPFGENLISIKIDESAFTGRQRLKRASTIDESVVTGSQRIKHGPSNAILSLLLPGLGHSYVNKTKNAAPTLISALYIGSAYMSYSLYKKSNDSYNNYLVATSQSVMDENFNAAVNYSNQSQIYMGAAAAILLYDFIYVIVMIRNTFKNIIRNIIIRNVIK